MEEEDEQTSLSALALSPRAAPASSGKKKGFFSLFAKKGKKSKNKKPPADSPLKEDTEQQRLVAEARKASRKKSVTKGTKFEPLYLTPEGAPPELPPKIRRGSLEDCYKVCDDCEARNVVTRDYCVSCGASLAALEPEGLVQAQRKLEMELDARRGDARRAAEAAAAARVSESSSSLSESDSELTEDAEPLLEPSRCVVSGAGVLSGPQRIAPLAFAVEPRGPKGEKLLRAESQVAAQVRGPGGVSIPVERMARADGSVEFSYDRSRAGAYIVSLMTHSGQVPLGESPYRVEATPVVDPALCGAEGPALDAGVFARVETELTVSLRDICGALIESDAPAKVAVLVGDTKCAVTSNGDGTHRALIEYSGAQTWRVEVRVDGDHVKGSPFEVEVAKKPSAGSKWQEQFEEEANARRAERERERQAELDDAKQRFLESAEEAKKRAAAKEAAQLEEERRLREIAQHQESMRSPRGDEVRAQVLAKLQEQDVEGDGTKAGAKWASKFREEDEARKAQRELERQEEIEQAKQNFLETAEEAKRAAAAKEEAQLGEEERQRLIAEHQEELRRRGVDDDPNDELSSDSSSTFERDVVAVDGGRRRARQQGVPPNNGVILQYDKVKDNVALFAGEPGVDVSQIEAHFSDEEFKRVFALEKSSFYKLPNWRRAQMRKEKGL